MDIADVGKAVIMGVVEGLTEFLPISSTGHLVITARLIGFDDPGEVFSVVIQLGAILAVCWYYRAKLWDVARRLPSDASAQAFALSVLIACLPAAVIGLKVNKYLEAHLFVPAVVATSTVAGGVAIIFIERLRHQVRHTEVDKIPWRTALGIGLCQLLSLIPGVSRSGATIMGALCLGVERKAATEFSFFLAIPIMFGASALKLVKHADQLTPDRLEIIGVGFVVSFVVALIVIHWLIRFVASNTFVLFGWYRIVAGVLLGAAMAAGFITSFT